MRRDVDFDEPNLSRRAFAAAAGGGVLAAASDPAAAAELREGPAVADTDADPVSEAFTPRSWLAVGPFQYQRRGVETGWLFPAGGEDAFAAGEGDTDAPLQSAFAAGATVGWGAVEASDGSVPLEFSDRITPTEGLMPLVDADGLTDDLQDWFGYGGVVYSAGYAITTFDLDAPRRAVLETDATAAWVNGSRYDEAPAGLTLQAGTNVVLVKNTVTLGAGSVSVSFRPPRAPVEVNDLAPFRGTPQNAVLPDLRAGESLDRPASVRVTNTTAEERDVTLTFAPESDGLLTVTTETERPLAPYETRRIETRVRTDGPVVLAGDGDGEAAAVDAASPDAGGEGPPGLAMTSTAVGPDAVDADRSGGTTGAAADFPVASSPVSVLARVTADGVTAERSIPLRVRAEEETRFQTTFVSDVDGSVQEFSVREPPNPDSEGPFDLVVALHGANVPSINGVGAYTQRENTYFVAPGARGPANYDHEDLGRVDDLDAMAEMKRRYDIDENAVYLTGHSMGGHGTWHVGLTNPDRFAGLAPSAGWTDHETYIVVPFERDKLYTHPRLKSLAETSLYKNLALPKTENAADGTLPTFVLHGGQDTSVPSVHPRTYVRALANRGLTVRGEVGRRYSNPDPDEVDAALLEVPGQGHWWDADIGEGADTVNHPDLMEFLLSTTRDPYPEHVHLFTTNLRVEHAKYWVAVPEQVRVYDPTRVDARVTDDGVAIETENVAVLELDATVFDERGGPRRALVDGESVSLPDGDTVYLDFRDDATRATASDPTTAAKGPDQYGPLKEVHQDRYLLVYGTAGSDAETEAARDLANLRSGRLVSRARAPATVVPDTAVTEADAASNHLVLFGRPETNSLLAEYADDLPVAVGDGEVTVGGETYEGDLGVSFVAPNPESDRLVQVESGTSADGLRLTGARDWTPTQTPTADYLVFDDRVRVEGWNAMLAAGFFDKSWEHDPTLGFARRLTGSGGETGDGGDAPGDGGDGVTHYQVDFVAGQPIENLGEEGLYADQDRLMRFAFGSADEGITEKDTAWPSAEIRDCVDYGHIVEDDGTASVTFTVADDCEAVTLSLVAYSMPGDEFSTDTANDQELLEAATGTYGPGEHTITVTLPAPGSD
ncbi:prolyl oligopeptidase family serine peptidase [Candidatus Halobonum tyrrellensis]|uniref:Alpha/beta hydrolase related protein n=1 Tax=Candidatus Halobonum tyrrellensis G22 TaxID=1324957 RepID=V4GRM0_9EURY|nr:prolyl oligopeptidase family serine peptidase [Candidatus Halobonum tyrrellensis]ESP87706.1 alpha/beta hydrolase related protein [Candidatus Halobonum tyrrellensis G22]